LLPDCGCFGGSRFHRPNLAGIIQTSGRIELNAEEAENVNKGEIRAMSRPSGTHLVEQVVCTADRCAGSIVCLRRLLQRTCGRDRRVLAGAPARQGPPASNTLARSTTTRRCRCCAMANETWHGLICRRRLSSPVGGRVAERQRVRDGERGDKRRFRNQESLFQDRRQAELCRSADAP